MTGLVKGYLEDLLQEFASRLNFTLREFTRIDRRWTPQDPVTKGSSNVHVLLSIFYLNFILIFMPRSYHIQSVEIVVE